MKLIIGEFCWFCEYYLLYNLTEVYYIKLV